jgi:hypothetical protein
MANFSNFDDHLKESLKDLHEAAYFLAASLGDAISENDTDHFFVATHKVAEATGKSIVEVYGLLKSHIAPADFPNVDENMSIMMARLVSKVESQNKLEEA